MFSQVHAKLVITGVVLLGAALPCAAQTAEDKDREIRRLKTALEASNNRYHMLARDLVASKKREAEMRKSMDDLRVRFKALGDNLLNGGEEKLLKAVKDAEVLDRRNRKIETSVHGLLANLRDFLRTAVASDPDARVRLETSIRELDATLGLRQKPRPQIAQGDLQQAKVVSIDTESGTLVINAGENQSVRRGMTFEVMRGKRKVAEAIAADTRKDFSGLLPTMLKNAEDQVRIGDIATIKTVER